MKERLNTAVEPGTVNRLRELAGGERRVGELLSTFSLWLWRYRNVLEQAPLEHCELIGPDVHKQLRDTQRELADIKALLRELGSPHTRAGGFHDV